MDILDFLTEDHHRLRGELVKVRKNLQDIRSRDHIRAFITCLEMHESVEEEILFPAVRADLEWMKTRDALAEYHEMHEKLWQELDGLILALERPRFDEFQRCFFNFAAILEEHMSREEHLLFPLVRKLLQKDTLEELTHRVEQRLERFGRVG